jgi:signal transduction histidine kinase
MNKKVHFKVSARTARLIGRENVSNSESALIELVKNAYDADAEKCVIYFDNKNQLHIMDNGHGMTDTVIENYWMTIGTNNKEHEYISKLGRIKSGEKGIGRFALDRLGRTCLMHTRPEDKKNGHIWIADWTDFENEAFETVEEIEADLDTVQFNLKDVVKDIFDDSQTSALGELGDTKFNNGTFISVENLRDTWELSDLKRLYKSLGTLIPPKEETTFEIFVYSEAHPNEFGRIETSPCDDYDYKVSANVTGENLATIKITRNEFDLERIDDALFKRPAMQVPPYDKNSFKQKSFEYTKKLSELLPGFSEHAEEKPFRDIGGFSFTFYFMKKHIGSDEKRKFFHKDINAKLRNEWLNEHVGIKIFRDNFRVRPYGEVNGSSMDWLGLGPRYGSNPAGVARKGQYKTREHNLSGIVDISRVKNPALKDLSSRTGIHEGKAFDIFKELLISIIAEFEYDRSYIAYEMSQLHEEKNPKAARTKQAEEIKIKIEKRKDNENKSELDKEKEILAQHAEDLKEERDELLNEQKILRVLASSGVMLATFGHEVHAMRNVINDRAATLRSLIDPYLDVAEAIDIPSAFNPYTYIEQTEETDKKLLHWMKFALSGIRKDRRNRKNIKLKTYFEELHGLWEVFLKDRKISLEINISDTDLKLKAFEAELDALFNNLLINSLEVFSSNKRFDERKILIDLARRDDQIELSYRDTGSGLSKDITDTSKIFDLYFSTKRDPNTGHTVGTGIGMYLVKSIVEDYGGTIKIKDANLGFALNILLPAVQERPR